MPEKRGLKLSPLQLLVLGYFLVALIGAWLLSLSVSSASGVPQPFVDALFVSVSGISTSGLTVVDIGSYYSLFGQMVLLCLFQIGGIGYMTFVMFLMYMLGVRLSVKTRIIARESMATNGLGFTMLGRFFGNVLLYTFVFEFIGGIILALFWMKDFSLLRSFYLGIFHSISAFCTAGFSLFPASLTAYRDNVLFNATINVISILGGIGFFVLIDLFNFIYRKYKHINNNGKLTLHSRIALWVTALVMGAGSLVIFLSEKWPAGMSFLDKVLTSTFQAISASTTDGFNTLDVGAMSRTGLTLLMALMFIGASPGSTGGGMKTTTLGTLWLSIKSFLQGRSRMNVFNREIPSGSVMKAFSTFSLFVVIMLADLLILSSIEKASYIQVLFEIVSALGNTGLSMGITANLTSLGKLVLIITMFIGRVGPLTIGTAFVSREENVSIRYPQEDIFIG